MNRIWLVLLMVALSSGLILASNHEGYLRHPDIQGDSVVFTAEGDLWLAPAAGGKASRLTNHVGNEYFPKFSPDGGRIAFTGQYDGNGDVFVISAEGGEPRRLTWHPSSDEVLGWTPDGERILFRSNREDPHGSYHLFSIPAKGGDPEQLPLGWAARLGIDPDSGRWAFNRTSRENRTWKRYRGGTATAIWVGHPDRADFKQITDFAGMNAFPMWHGGRVYFLSDRGGTANLWSIKPDGTDRKQHTDLGKWDARFPSMGPDGRIVFMLAGDVHLFDPSSGGEQQIDIELPSDRVLTRARYSDVSRYLTFFDLSPDGERVALTVRGEIFSVPVEDGVTLPVTRGSGARESWASFGPEGKRLVFVTDEKREEEIRTVDAWGRGEPQVVKSAGDAGWHFPPEYSPDGKWVAYADQTHTLYVIPSESGKPTKVDRSEQSEIGEYTWSPDSRWLAYSKNARTDYSSIFIYDTKEGKTHRVTGSDTDDFSPAWDPEGRYIYFLSARTTNPLLGYRDLENVNIRPTKPYMALLRSDVDNPFAHLAGLPPDEEEKEEGEDEGDEKSKKKDKADGKDGDKKAKDEKEEVKPIEIEFEGLTDRVVVFPVDAGQYFGLSATKKQVFYISAPLQGMADWPALFAEASPNATLLAFDLEKKKAKPFLEGVSGYSLSVKADKLAVMKRRGELYVVGTAAPPGSDLAESKVSLDGVVLELDPREEWEQIFHEGWRHMRDFYWDAGLGGVDWNKIREQYASLLPRLATRDDLRDVMGEVIGELSTSHTYVFGGDRGVSVPRVSTGLLGADLVREGDAFRVDEIYRGAPADGQRSPLVEPGVNVNEGDYILAVNHLPFDIDRPFYAAFEGLARKEVLLTVNDKPTSEGARDVVVRTLPSEYRVRYCDWVRRNREYVAEKTDGKIGYVHIPDMMSDGMIAFNTWFYPQLDKEGMVVDTRWNGGGFVSQMVLERFTRRLVSFDRARGGGVSSYPYRVLNGPFVVLTNEFAGSDGDIFPAAVQLAGLAPIIGMRSWGGVVGIRGDKRLVDGGFLTQPEFAWWDPVRGWELENRGVEPDIEVQNSPQQLADGIDAQLDRGITEVMKLHGQKPPIKPDFGPARPRNREAYKEELTAD
jgi:tricorn protease